MEFLIAVASDERLLVQMDRVDQVFHLREWGKEIPFHLSFVADMLTLFINRAKAEDQLSGVVSHLIDGGLSILQYADDTILDHNLEQA